MVNSQFDTDFFIDNCYNLSMKNIFDPKEFNFKESIHYPEIHDFFGGKTFVKAIAEHNNGKDHLYWYKAIKISVKDFASDERY